MNAGLVMLPRSTDKAVASNENTLGEYHYGCPLDVALFDFLGVDKDAFATKVKELGTDEEIAEWVNSLGKTQEEKNKFNNKMRHKQPDNEQGRAWLKKEQERLGRSDYYSFFDNLDADEKRF
tara:strand:- start:342 stop:707 length:366 start_codon:yes stop_codon:yes gene_type:complete